MKNPSTVIIERKDLRPEHQQLSHNDILLILF